MLKGKKGIYILIPLNIFIWSFFVYRIFYYESEDTIVEISQTRVNTDNLTDTAIYKLKMNYEDPFLKKEAVLRSHNLIGEVRPKQEVKKTETKIKPKEEPVKEILDVKYLGLVKNNSSGFATAIVSINGTSRLIKQDEVVGDMCFKNFTNESLTILKNKEKIVIQK
ncbi:MAG: hypothetical protein ACK50A_00050 [Sphingobacteriaceae bacterium]|jgi:hypothetical protein